MPYRLQQSSHRRWIGRTLPGPPGCWAYTAITAMLTAIVAVGYGTFALATALGVAFGVAFAVAHIAGALAGAGLLFALRYLDVIFKRATSLAGHVDADGTGFHVRLPGLAGRRRRFDIGPDLRVECNSFEVEGDTKGTYLVLEQAGRRVTLASPGVITAWSGEIAITHRATQPPRGADVVDLEHAAFEELMRSLDDELELRGQDRRRARRR